MIHLVLDTNIYRHDPERNGLNFTAIERLSRVNILLLHIPYVVEREFQTQQREIYFNSLAKAISSLSGLSRRKLSQTMLDEINGLKKKLESESEKILFEVENELIVWAKSIGANRFPLCIDQAYNSLEAYFQGKPPLSAPKAREDIPDSFIVQAIKKLCVDKETIHVVSGDKKIREAFIDDKNITVYTNLNEFVESDFIQNELKELDLLENIEGIYSYFKAFEREQGEISKAISENIGEALMFKTFEDPSISDDNNEATIQSFYEAEEIELDFTNIFYYGNGKFGIPFGLKILVGAFYYIFKADYYCLSEKEQESIQSITDHNDHYYEAESEFEVEVQGTVSININRDEINSEDFSECVDPDEISIDEIESIELLDNQ